ncbi:hypothetical protein SAMN06297144_1215 [Sphingomonas guangdongensis]|uniref:Uncharacterized protein n=1 Tax=Sphingomonas guangdongensis TaxID=1141890 RepID=A0A285QH02_9SPHN|nr:hypothetical protein [Sphingomonas guangdongensis]SOB80744.1 hypothetical protein SAMN06297144_1215 [Sphingomonas guangdongensis]
MQGSEQRSSAPPSSAPVRRTPASTGAVERPSNPWPVVIGAVGLLAVIGLASSDGGSDQATTPEPVVAASQAAAPPEPAPPEVESDAIRRADRHAELAIGAEGASGAMVYSVNCWAAVERSFSLATLDRCGAFDALARRVRMDPAELAAESAWFDATAANERYAATAKAGGMEPVVAGERLARVLALADAEVLEPRLPAPAEAEIEAIDAGSDDGDVSDAPVEEDLPATEPSTAPELDLRGFGEPREGANG